MKIDWSNARLDASRLVMALNNEGKANGLMSEFMAWNYRVEGAGRLCVIARGDGIDIARFPVGDDGRVAGADVSAFIRGGNILKGKRL